VLLDGDFQFDLSRAAPSPGDFWTIVSSANTSYGSNFTVAGFSEGIAGQWSNTAGYFFSEATGRLTFGTAVGDFLATVPEPSSLLLVALASLGIIPRCRRNR
jgi:hypothetical protein